MPRGTPNSKLLALGGSASPKPLPAALPNSPISDVVDKLRKDYRWAMISQFLFLFADAAGIDVWDIDVSIVSVL